MIDPKEEAEMTSAQRMSQSLSEGTVTEKKHPTPLADKFYSTRFTDAHPIKDGSCISKPALNREALEMAVDAVIGSWPEPGEAFLHKSTNPKDAVGIRKVPASCVSRVVVAEMGLGMLEGALKYGRHNYRVAGVRASVYFDAAHRHLDAYWEGQDIDPASGLHHITKALATLAVLRDAMLNDMLTDDRPPKAKDQNWVERLNEKAAALLDKYPDPVPAYTETDGY